jgi:hypothetical protein
MKKALPTLALVALSLLSACGGGGGGGDSPAAATAEGLWSGSGTSNGTSFDVGLVILDDGTFYAVYSVGGSAVGLLQGVGATSGDAFGSASGRDFPFGGGTYTPFTLQSRFATRTSISGTAQGAGFNATFNAVYDASYDAPVNLADVAGAYSGSAGTLSGASGVSLVVAVDGSFSGISAEGCRVNGRFAPRAADKAVLNMSLTFDAPTCGTGASVTGVAGRSGSRGLTFAATLPDRSDAFYGLVTKP